MFWSKKKPIENPKTIDNIIDVLKMIQTRLNMLEADSEGLKAKFRKRLLPKSDDLDNHLESKGIDDGFNELRKLNKQS